MKTPLQMITIGLFTCAVILPSIPSTVHAEGSPYRANVTETSLRGALGGRSIPLLEAVPPKGGRDEQLARLMKMLDASPDRRIHARDPQEPQISKRSTTMLATDGSWYLQVVGDGSRFLYRGNIDDPTEIEEAARFGQLDMKKLEMLGRKFITEQLASLVSLPVSDSLVFLGTKYLREGSASEKDQQFTSEVVANIALFGREVRGTYVAGPGSKIAVWFSNSGEPVGFDVDWPTYQLSRRTQSTLDINRVWDRMTRYADHPLDLIQRNTTRFECGYVDLGVHKRPGQMIQAGCTAHHDGPLPDGVKYAAIETMPIGVEVVEDSSWPVTQLIVTGQEPVADDSQQPSDPEDESGRFPEEGGTQR
ncbi:MAG: hypothetical protein AB7G75_20680 [Candidatus Binatia bacterium]